MNKTTYQQVVEEQMKEFDEKFCTKRICQCCGNKECDYSTTGCPWYRKNMMVNADGTIVEAEEVKAFLHSFASTIAEVVRGEEREKFLKIIGKNDDTNGKDGSAIWAGSRNGLRREQRTKLTSLRGKGK